jgi:hypothetical protein
MAYKPRIKLIIATNDSHSVSEAIGENATDAMYDAAWDLVYTLMTGKRRKPKPRYKAYREKKERAAAKFRANKPKRKRTPRKKPALTLMKGGAGNSDPIGLHSMAENNRSDEQT